MTSERFRQQFTALTGKPPFPWQASLYLRMTAAGGNNIPQACTLPTGLGKTSVIAIWLIALAEGANVPRRLVYVVNRRTVVDQTTTEVQHLRENLATMAKLGELRVSLEKLCAFAPGDNESPLAISTLRGQFADNRKWTADPSRPAVICGTVDMIGSRLLFSGYGVGFRGKPLHAGFLGQDALIVHDEAHLEPAFQELLVAIQREQTSGRFPDRHPLRVMELTATTRGAGEAFPNKTERKANAADPIVQKRINAKKTIRLHEVADSKKLADAIVDLAANHKDSGLVVLVFVHKVDDLEKVVKKLPSNSTKSLTGTLRGLEREDLITTPIFQRFLPLSSRDDKVTPRQGTVYLVCTSAGEVGVNISADHLVCDLTPFDSMAQRFGRVNRFGDSENTTVDIVHQNPSAFDEAKPYESRLKKTLGLLQQLNGSGSPASLDTLDATVRVNAFTPPPTILKATDILFDAWAMTSIRNSMPGRPKVEPYLHGIRDWEPPQTKVGWREEVSTIASELRDEYRAENLLEVYPIKPYELLADNSDRILNTLKKLASTRDLPIWIVSDEGDVEVTNLLQIVKGRKEAIQGTTLLLPPELGGLEYGFFTNSAPYDEVMRYDIADEWRIDGQQMRTRIWQHEEEPTPATPTGMKPVARIDFTDSDDDDERPLKAWHWFVRLSVADPDARGQGSYDLQPHLDDARDAATKIVAGLSLDPDLRRAVILAAKYHDLGKDRERWQNGIGNHGYPDVKWAKSGKRPLLGERSSYRHEFGSVLDVWNEPDFKTLPVEAQELVLHLIAAHHGRARPHFDPEECFDDKHPPEAARNLAIDIPCRFARLQRTYGRWGLAYLESLVRVADYTASARAEGGMP